MNSNRNRDPRGEPVRPARRGWAVSEGSAGWYVLAPRWVQGPYPTLERAGEVLRALRAMEARARRTDRRHGIAGRKGVRP